MSSTPATRDEMQNLASNSGCLLFVLGAWNFILTLMFLFLLDYFGITLSDIWNAR